ncbi:hypothetical protein Ae356Ps1_3387c [Pseudonocardia sp. Ae356_Ps1]|nr:hypothetical protein Ae150APs1_6149c [Pseudonocardia sp. Ae150A_Ps1]OLL70067.1 hypothetical protein Ae150APs1_6155 [Pseudonocardia sp. Ae150A_Ps1]OLL93490.1 hypothetical protein Ae356Ps1_3387c [Pseudonocardia sp. Ae356_Ps1]
MTFVIDCYSRAIVGWHAATTKTTSLVTTALIRSIGTTPAAEMSGKSSTDAPGPARR